MKKLILFSSVVALVGCANTASTKQETTTTTTAMTTTTAKTEMSTTAANASASKTKKFVSANGALSLTASSKWIDMTSATDSEDVDIALVNVSTANFITLKGDESDSVTDDTLSFFAKAAFAAFLEASGGNRDSLVTSETTIAGKKAIKGVAEVTIEGQVQKVDLYTVKIGKQAILISHIYATGENSEQLSKEAYDVINTLANE
ncbi:hypothetical protein KG089_02920 [Carnobacteriaceae bacterium zg-ZUI252]|nr:hypothetical protein [Carnobacteriaceae bacterium zg-ZUI252]MBS4769912.1 hypothetical protein [Carnobacteriaceae bacterium zg-ZUI240]